MQRMVEVGKAHGLKGLRADVLVVNSAMIALLRAVGADEVPPPDGGVVGMEFRFKETATGPQLADTAMVGALTESGLPRIRAAPAPRV